MVRGKAWHVTTPISTWTWLTKAPIVSVKGFQRPRVHKLTLYTYTPILMRHYSQNCSFTPTNSHTVRVGALIVTMWQSHNPTKCSGAVLQIMTLRYSRFPSESLELAGRKRSKFEKQIASQTWAPLQRLAPTDSFWLTGTHATMRRLVVDFKLLLDRWKLYAFSLNH